MHRNPEWTISRTLFRELTLSSGILAWICEADGHCIYLSPGWHNFTGSSDGEGINWLNAIHPADRVRTRKAFFDANDSQSRYDVEYRLAKADGTYTMAVAHGVPYFDERRHYQGLYGLTTPAEHYVREADFIASIDNTPKARVLSDREREVLALFAEGYTSETAGVKLGISESTVDMHARNAASKLQANNRVHSVVLALRLNELKDFDPL